LCLVADAFAGKGGIAQYNRDFLRSLAKTEISPSIVVLARHAAAEKMATPFKFAQRVPRGGRVAYAISALWLTLRWRPQVLYCGHLNLAPLAAFLAWASRAKLVVQMHGIEAWQCPGALHQLAVEAADLVLCVSRYTRASILSWAALSPERVCVLPNTVDENFTPGDGSVLRSELGLAGKRIILTVGRMDHRERYKGHDRVSAAIPRLVGQGHDVAYVVVGEGDDRERLAALAEAAGIAERVIFLGPVTLEQLRDAYRMADLFVMPSTGEGFGIAYLEAMACGTPALGLQAAGAVDALADGDLGTLTSEHELPAAISDNFVKPKSPSALAEAVRRRFGPAVFAANVRNAMLRLYPRQSEWMQRPR